MPVINTQTRLGDLHSQVMSYEQVNGEDLSNNMANEIIVDARQVDFKDAAQVEPIIAALQSLQPYRDDKTVGVLLAGETDIAVLLPWLTALFDNVSLIAIEFGGFRDGRGYSLAKELQQQANYPATIVLRATGDVIADSLPLLARVGFEQFEIKDDIANDAVFGYFDSIQHFYDGQSAQALPIFNNL